MTKALDLADVGSAYTKALFMLSPRLKEFTPQ